MALTKAQQQSWDNNKLYWINRYNKQDKLNEKDYKLIEKKYKEELKKAKDEVLKELAYQKINPNYLSNSQIDQYFFTWLTIDKTLDEIATKEEKELGALLENKYKEVYNENIKILGLENSFHTLNEGLIKEAVKTNWSGLEFSDRIWKNKELLTYKIKEEFQKGLIRGDSLQQISNSLIKNLNSSFKNTMRLVRTETCAIQSRATIDSYRDSGVVSKYEFSAFLDHRTSPQCIEMDGQIIDIKEGIVGVNLPPLHPHCRSCILPVVDDNETINNNAINNPVIIDSIEVDPIVNNDKLSTEKEETKENNRETDRNRDRRRRFISYTNKFELQESEFNKKSTKFISTLKKNNEDVYKSLRAYTGSEYQYINGQLRKNEKNNKDEIIKNISKGIKKFKTSEEFMVHRGTSINAIKGLFSSTKEFEEVYEKCLKGEATQEYLNEKFVGNILVDKGFMSTSMLEHTAFTKDLTLHINIEKGTNYGAYINKLSNYQDKEFEFLLDKNLAMEIYDIEADKNGRLSLYLNIVGRKRGR